MARSVYVEKWQWLYKAEGADDPVAEVFRRKVALELGGQREGAGNTVRVCWDPEVRPRGLLTFSQGKMSTKQSLSRVLRMPSL